MRSPLSLFSPNQTGPAPAVSPQKRCCRPLTISVASAGPSLEAPVPALRSGHSTAGVPRRTEQRAGSPPWLLATLLPMHPGSPCSSWPPGHCWLMSACPQQYLRSCSAEAQPSPFCAWGCPSQCRTLHCLCWTSGCSLPSSPACQGLAGWQHSF